MNRQYLNICILITTCLILWIGCGDDDLDKKVENNPSLTHISYNPTSIDVVLPAGFPQLEVPLDNPMTQQGVELGRHLFFDPILSADSTISCATCHKPELSFTDGLAVSIGVNGALGRRSAMSLLNVGLHRNVGFFWDGRAKTLEEQALEPIVDPKEMANTWEEVERRLRRSQEYRTRFREAFGISYVNDISRDLAAKAMAQFERTLVSSGTSAWDLHNQNITAMEDDAISGFELFFDEKKPDAECGHCHGGSLFTTNQFINNGLDSVYSVSEYTDLGRGEVTGQLRNFGQFKVPTLRNIMLTAPYMHDGRFKTIEEVLDHYNGGGHHVINQDEDNVDLLMQPQGLGERQKRQLIAYLEALTDTAFVHNPDFQAPVD